ncbi:hypothetical protein [Fimbriiglobus ruber]|uniref:Ribose ABC transport system, periplasmic ribose-binding protein RbsB n=1 Tax=Fimbriiglobus ruber TaxID=1908690 RepID=A0A225DHA8_9BACT|nr:hypothetical protein [Fimbriiglobus ruber]OWK40812.1 Ribose ABC transport system, periplasmic ribose-binding protein RbsB [Fimbriiglobus ruber]
MRTTRPRFRAELLEDRVTPSYALDPTFGTTGTAMWPLAPNGWAVYATNTYVQPDGRIVELGQMFLASKNEYASYVTRLTADGQVDPTFNGGNSEPVGQASALAFAPDGDLVIVGRTPSSALDNNAPADTYSQVAITVLNPDGTADTAFNGTGYETLSLDPSDGTIDENGGSVAVASDGSITVLGFRSNDGAITQPESQAMDPVVVRLNPDGALDTTFNGTGKQTIPADQFAMVQSAGTVFVTPAGGVLVVGGQSHPIADASPPVTDIGVVRLDAAGQLDTTFNGTGHAVYPSGLTVTGAFDGAVATPDGQILTLFLDAGDQKSSVTRLASDGSLDTGFGANGSVQVAGYPVGAAGDASGNVVVATTSTQYQFIPLRPGYVLPLIVVSNPSDAVRLYAFNSAGNLDPTFGSAGQVVHQLGASTEDGYGSDRSLSLAMRPDGRVILTQTSTDDATQNGAFQYDPTSSNVLSPDPNFGTGGTATLTPPTGQLGQVVDGTSLEPDGSVLVFGHVTPEIPAAPFLTRLTPTGQTDPTFNGGRELQFDPFVTLKQVAYTPDGHIVVVGNVLASKASFGTIPMGQYGTFVARLNPDGSYDTSFNGTGWETLSLTGGAAADGVLSAADGADGTIDLLVSNSVVAQPGVDYAPGVIHNADPIIVRLNADGTLDTAFNGTGTLTLPAAALGLTQTSGSLFATATGGLLFVGTAPATGTGTHPSLAVARLNPDGTLDTTFGTAGTGVAVYDTPTLSDGSGDGFAGVASATQGPDGHILVLASYDRSLGSPDAVVEDAAVVRLTADGSLDTGFGTNGVVTVPGTAVHFPVLSGALIAGGADGSVTTATWSQPTSGGASPSLILARFDTTGSPDPAFGPGGAISDPIVANVASLSVRPDGQVLVGEYDFTTSTEPGAVSEVVQYGSASPPVVPPPPVSPPPVSPPPSPPAQPPEVAVPAGQEVVLADVNGDGVNDIITTGTDGTTLEVINGATGTDLVAPFHPFEVGFTGTIGIAAADLSGTGRADVIVTAGAGGGARVIVYDGATLAAGSTTPLFTYFGIPDPAFRGGARLAVADVTGDGVPDVIVAAGAGGGPRVTIWDGASILAGHPVVVEDFFAFEPSVQNGVFVSAGDFAGTGGTSLAFGAGPGSAPRVRVFDAAQLLAAGPFATLDQAPAAAQLANFYAGDPNQRTGAQVAIVPATASTPAELYTRTGAAGAAPVNMYSAAALTGAAVPSPDQTLDATTAAATPALDGVFVG